jgi:hypothetical protein
LQLTPPTVLGETSKEFAVIAGISKVATAALIALSIGGCGGAGPLPPPTHPAGTGAPSTGTGSPAGSGDPTPAGQPAGSIDACALLSEQEIEAGTSRPVLEINRSNLTRVFPSMCDIDLVEGGTITIGIMPSGGRSMYECCFEAFIGEGENPPLDRAVDGLGDKAGIADDSDLMVLKGDVLFDIVWTVPGVSNKEQVLRYLAEVILLKLPCLAAGCPGLTLPPPPPSAEPAFDACSLLTEQEIADATDYKAAAGEPVIRLGGVVGCRWGLDTEGFTDHVEVLLNDVGGREEFDMWTTAYEPPLEHVPGLGDDAIKTGTIPSGRIYAVVGDRLVTLSFEVPYPADDPYAGYALVEPLVALALSRLP